MCISCLFTCVEYWRDVTERNRAHRAFAEGGFFFRKAEMQKRINEAHYKELAGNNIHTAIDIIQPVQHFDPQLKEVTYAKEFLDHMTKDEVYARVLSRVTKVQLPLAVTSSDDTPGSESDATQQQLEEHELGAESVCRSLTDDRSVAVENDGTS